MRSLVRLRISRRGIFGKRETTIAVKNLIGASVARASGRVNLALAVGARSHHPVILAFDDEVDASLATNALGIGRNGFGVVVWERAPKLVDVYSVMIRVAATIGCLIICVVAKLSDPFAARLDAQSVCTLVIVAALALVMLSPLVIARQTLSLTRQAVVVFEDRIRTLLYESIATIRLENGYFVIDRAEREKDARGTVTQARIPFVKRTSFLSGLDDVDTMMIVDHVTTAAERARTTGEPHEQVRALLAKRDRETNDAWVRRIDELAESWRASPPRYGESVDNTQALWQAVEDHDCDETLRSLAARMLAKLDPENAPRRILRVAKAIRIPRQASRIRVALETEVEPMAKSIAVKSSR